MEPKAKFSLCQPLNLSWSERSPVDLLATLQFISDSHLQTLYELHLNIGNENWTIHALATYYINLHKELAGTTRLYFNKTYGSRLVVLYSLVFSSFLNSIQCEEKTK